MSAGRSLGQILVDADEHIPDGRPYLPGRVDSWLERRFAWQAIKYLRPEVELRSQVDIATEGGTFRVDFLTAGYRVNLAFECDGAAYHTDPKRDADRDGWLLRSEDLWGIYHLPYRDLVEYPEWCFLGIAERHYVLFTDSGLVNLRTLTQRFDGPTRLRMSYRCKATPNADG